MIPEVAAPQVWQYLLPETQSVHSVTTRPAVTVSGGQADLPALLLTEDPRGEVQQVSGLLLTGGVVVEQVTGEVVQTLGITAATTRQNLENFRMF